MRRDGSGAPGKERAMQNHETGSNLLCLRDREVWGVLELPAVTRVISICLGPHGSSWPHVMVGH